MTSPYLGAMLAHEFQEKRIKSWPVAVEPKLDGIRITFVDGEGYTRNGRTFPTLKPFADVLAENVSPGTHVDAEAKALNWNRTSSLLKRIKKIDFEAIRSEVVVWVFDAFNADTIGKEPYSERRKAVEWIAAQAAGSWRICATDSEIVHDRAELDAEFQRRLREGFEGVMVKPLDGVYTLKRSWAWQKVKPFRDITVTIRAVTHGWELCRECMTKERREARAAAMDVMGIFDPNDIKPDPSCPTCHGAAKGVPRPDLLGSLVCVDEHGNEWGVGMGFTDADKVALMKDPPIGKQCDVKIQEEAAGESANAITGRHGVFLRFREKGE